VRQSNWSGAKKAIEDRNIAKYGNKSCLKEKSKVAMVVFHTLISYGKCFGFADYKIRPLHTND